MEGEEIEKIRGINMPRRLTAEISKDKLHRLAADVAEQLLLSSEEKAPEHAYNLAEIKNIRKKLALVLDHEYYLKASGFLLPLYDILKSSPIDIKFCKVCLTILNHLLHLIESRLIETGAKTHEMSDHSKRGETEEVMEVQVLKGQLEARQPEQKIEKYISTGKDKFVIDPDPNLIYSKRKLEKLGKSQTLCVTSSNSPVRSKIIYPKDSWSKSLKKLPLFTRAEMDEHVARTGKHLGNSKDHKVPTGLRKAKTFQKDQYLKDIQTNYDQRYFYFKCSCYHSFRKNDTPHELRLTLCIVSGQVIDSLCTCVAGKTGFCNHSLALMFLICKFSLFNCNTTADLKDDPLLNPDVACTSKLQSWHKKVRGDSIYPQPVMDVVVSKTKLDNKENEGNCIQSILYEARKNKTLLPSTAEEKKYKQTLRQINPKMGLAAIGHIETDLKETKFGCSPVGSYASYQLSHTESNFVVHCNVSAIPRANNSLPLIYPQFPFKKFEEYALPENLSELERNLIDSLIVDENCINKTEKGTRDQCASEQWKSERKYRFTASKFQLISRRQRNHSSFAQDLMYPKPFQSRYTKHGTKYEPVAIDMYQKYMKSKEMLVYVFKCGFIISADLPFLGGSPDGKIIDPGSSKPFGLLEVKCPETKFLVSPFSACSDSNFFCYRDGEKCKLKTSHAYYALVQGQMGVSGVDWCDFVVYTKKGMSVERIPFNNQYWNDLKQQLSNYYFAHFIQHAAADYANIYQVTQ